MNNKLNTILSPKPSDEQRKANEHTRYLFIMAMMNMDDRMLLHLLAKEGQFFGYMNKWQVAHWLRGKFNNFDRFAYHSTIKTGFSNEIFPGAEVFEFTYTDADFDEEDNLFTGLPEDEKRKFNKRESVIRLVLQFGNRHITGMRLTKTMFSTQLNEKYQINN